MPEPWNLRSTCCARPSRWSRSSKLYAGGLSSKADILELLRRNPGVDLDEIRAVCKRYRLRGLEDVLAELE